MDVDIEYKSRTPLTKDGQETPAARNKYRPKTVYLAGPITGLTYGECTDWREYAKQKLEWEERPFDLRYATTGQSVGTRMDRVPTGITALSPMRTKEWLDDGKPIPGMADMYDTGFVVARDHNDVRTSDVILMNLAGAEKVSVGTMVELGWASALNKFIVVVMSRDETTGRQPGMTSTNSPNPHDHLFVYELASITVDTLDEGIAIAKNL